MKPEGAEKLRESIRLLERHLGLLEETQSSCCSTLTLQQCHVLVEVGRDQGLTLNRLATLLGLDKSTMSRTVNTLVDRGLVDRQAAPDDRRFVSLQLTPSGAARFNDVETTMNQRFAEIFQAIPQGRQEQVLESLHLLIEALGSFPPVCCLEKDPRG